MRGNHGILACGDSTLKSMSQFKYLGTLEIARNYIRVTYKNKF